MRAQQPFLPLLCVVLLLLAIPFRLRAQPLLPQNSETAVGDPKHIMVVTKKPGPAAAAAVKFTFLPLVTGAKESSISSEAQEVVDLVNAERAQAGCSPLHVSSQLTAAAQGHSEDMALNDYFSHTSLDGRSPWDRIHAEGYDFWSAAENIAAGYTSPASVMAGWMDSSGHRANILNCDLEEIGVGYYYLANDTGKLNYRHYWTQDFGAR